jgi:two-component system, OmpR family, response regulator
MGMPEEKPMPEKVLLVDDEPDFLEVTAERMEARGMNVVTATSAEEALDIISKESFDAVVLDFMMPGMDGIKTLRKLKGINPDLQIILLTGYATIEKSVEAMKLGAMDFMEKPADIEKLAAKIKKAKTEKMVLGEKRSAERIQKILEDKGW